MCLYMGIWVNYQGRYTNVGNLGQIKKGGVGHLVVGEMRYTVRQQLWYVTHQYISKVECGTWVTFLLVVILRLCLWWYGI